VGAFIENLVIGTYYI